MAKFVSFAYNQYGSLVYRSTGKLAPESYTVRGNTVYHPVKDQQGNISYRKIGNIGKGTAKERRTITRTAERRVKSLRKQKLPETRGRFTFNKLRVAREASRAAGIPMQTPEISADEAKKFGKSVRNMGLLSAGRDSAAYQKIAMMDDKKLLQLYKEQDIVFEVYFEYGNVANTSKGLVGGEETLKNAKNLIDVYEKRFGPIMTQAKLV